ncbi:dienelactone hydrolase family protein [Pigmentibacter sp. JX0631]|uniref:dienelactone hydrolase family protein n=1 Tax=Pigmentibacter sp. JX0631 TaxID=2976982 RepID=UPI0024686A22|nr:dienelactone hydrolase family protein [Pigmentibacter sp. JX0631]WGL60013.1 dienelactone hydrolase family protein [Pigmentibacter sp. JX0631]
MTKIENSEKMEFNRRDFLLKSLALSGYALAVYPLAYSAIQTDQNGIEVSDVKIPVGKIKIPAYQAFPKGNKPFPVIIICHEIFGVHEYIKDLCRRFAKLGYYAIAPSLYFRQGEVNNIKEISEIIAKVVSKVTNKQVNTDLDATVKFVKESKKIDANKMYITGFCWGGKATWLYAAHNPELKAAIAWYGPLLSAEKTQEEFPIDIAAKLKVPVLGLYGGKDARILPEHIEKMNSELKKGTSNSKIIVYPDAEHGFFADYRPSYNQMASDEALREMLKWIKDHS